MVIPMIGNRYVVVTNKKSRNKTFPGGGCKKNENTKACALRELREETYGAIVLTSLPNQVGQFRYNKRSRKEQEQNDEERVKVEMTHHVFLVPLGNRNFGAIRRTYGLRQLQTGNNKPETNGINLVTHRQLDSNKVWNFVRNYAGQMLKPPLTKSTHVRVPRVGSPFRVRARNAPRPPSANSRGTGMAHARNRGYVPVSHSRPNSSRAHKSRGDYWSSTGVRNTNSQWRK